jgi:hypothetical protein
MSCVLFLLYLFLPPNPLMALPLENDFHDADGRRRSFFGFVRYMWPLWKAQASVVMQRVRERQERERQANTWFKGSPWWELATAVLLSAVGCRNIQDEGDEDMVDGDGEEMGAA